MAKHTPGPWIYDDGDSDAIGVFGPDREPEAVAQSINRLLDRINVGA